MLYVIYLKPKCRCYIMNYFFCTFGHLCITSSFSFIICLREFLLNTQKYHKGGLIILHATSDISAMPSRQIFFCLKKSEKKSYFYSLVASTLLCGENLDTFSWVAFLLDLALFSPKILGSMLISNASVKSQERAVLRALYMNNLKILREILYLLSSQKHHASPNKNRFVMIQ